MPVIPVTYWSFRFMIGLGMGAAAGAALVLWLTRRGRAPDSAAGSGLLLVALPLGALAGNSFGWIFTEMGRQPWAVFGLMTTDHAVSPGSQRDRGLDLGDLADRALRPARGRRGRRCCCARSSAGAEEYVEPPDPTIPTGREDDDAPLAFAY